MAEGAKAGDGQAGLRDRRGLTAAGKQEQAPDVPLPLGTNGGLKHSYWLDLWLFFLIDLLLFVFVYLLP
ncbi:sarcoplasmic/endoplasmic reticulum calcium ATPase regulator ARLN [Tenrec ecaudatus]|uniref:sarcoplasmic/endoplasmic reticulum calcium ATPase regulator ARLN n=1 Tax=Tenrec ecaudatus TaxID=94439 RepID=UPI003F59A8E9